jgi:Sulfotransferase family
MSYFASGAVARNTAANGDRTMTSGFQKGVSMTSKPSANTQRGAQINVDQLMQRAQAAANLKDFGDPWFRAPLTQLVEFINREAGLTSEDAPPVLGLVGNLADRLRLVDYLKRHPQVRSEKLDVAGVIIGLPRGGSTLLQRLLSTSPQLTSTYWWEMISPVPYPDEILGEPAARMAAGRAAADAIHEAWPEMKSMHPIDAMGYDEEIILIDRSFLSLMYPFYFDIPSYAHWQTQQDHRKAYKELTLWLQLFQFSAPARRNKKWLLKSPHHLLSCGLETKILMTHRAMEKVIPSFCSNQSLTMRDSALNFDEQRLGPQAIQMFIEALRNMLAVRSRFPAERFIDVQYQDVMRDPLGQFERAMNLMGLIVGPADQRAATTWMAQNGRDTHPRHQYSAAEYGTTNAKIVDAFKFYSDALMK